MGTRSIYVSILRDKKSLDTTVSRLFLFVDNIEVCEMNWMGARKTPEQNHEDYLKCVLAMNENVEIEIYVVLIVSWRGCM